MYEAYWQLRQKPFENCADPRFYYPGESHQAALLKLRYAVENQRGGALLCGASGSGKTLLVSIIGVLFKLMLDADQNVILTTYADSLAEKSSHQAKALVTEFSSLLGFEWSSDRKSLGRWKIRGHSGGLLAGVFYQDSQAMAPDS